MTLTSLRARLTKIAGLLAGVSLLWACNAPPIVVPPPGAVSVAFATEQITDAAGAQTTVWTASQKQPLPDAALARFFLFDQTLGAGVVQTADQSGTFASTPWFAGTMNDQITLYYETPAGDRSDTLCLLLRVVQAPPGLAPTCP